MNDGRQLMKKALVLGILTMFLCGLMPLVSADGENIIGYYPLVQHVTVGETFYTNVNVTVATEIDAAAIDNLTFQPAGKINYTSYTKGDLFSGTTMWIDPSSGTISNSSGYVESWLWTHTGKANNTNATFVNITWKAYDTGIAYINQTEGGTAYGGGPITTLFQNETIYVHPYRPMQTNVAATNETILNLRWNPDWGSYGDTDQVLIRYNTSGSPSTNDHTDGIEAYNGTGDYATATLQQWNHTGLSSGTTYYYVFWAYNSTYNMYSLLGTADSGSTDDTNNPPVIGSPLTTNNSKLSYRTSLVWQIPVSDAEGDSMNLYVNCSSGQTQNWGTATNATYGLATSGLTPGWYTVWVNVSDPLGSGTWTREWFTFKINGKPSGGGGGGSWDPDPPNAAPSVSINTALSVDVNDSDGDFVTVKFYWENDSLIGTDTVPSGDGTASVNPSTLSYETEYSWYVKANDSLDTTTSDTWTFNTSSLGININKEWVAVPANNTVHAWINVTNTGSTNFTDVWIWDIQSLELNYASSNYVAWMNGHLRFNITDLNASGYFEDNKTISIWFNLTSPISNGTCFWNHANVSHLGQTDSINVTGLCYGYTVTKEVNSSTWDENENYTYWINITNTGDFSLLNLWVNETYDSNCTYVSNHSTPVADSSNGNNSWLFNSIAPGGTVSITIVVNASGVNGSHITNTVNTNTSMGTTRSATAESYIGVHTTMLRISYTSEMGNILNMIFSAFGLIMIMAIVLAAVAIMTVVMVLKRKGEDL